MPARRPGPRPAPWRVAVSIALVILIVALARIGGDNLPFGEAGLVVLVIVVIAALFGLGLAGTFANRRIQRDIDRTADPIIERYRQSHDVASLERDVDEWFAQGHGPAACSYLVQAVTIALMDDHEYEAATRQLDQFDASELPTSVRKGYQEFLATARKRIEEGMAREAAEAKYQRSKAARSRRSSGRSSKGKHGRKARK